MKFITHAALANLVDSLTGQYAISAPRDMDGMLLYRPVAHSSEIVWEYIRPALSVKEAIFPATDAFLHIEKLGGEIRLTEMIPERSQVVLGVRPCDARGLTILDAAFLHTPPVDASYAARRANTTLVGLACQEMGETCFCTSMGILPDEAADMDVMLTPVDGGYLVEIVTEKGARLFPSALDEAPEAVANAASARWSSSAVSTLPQTVNWATHFDDPYWDRLADRCLSCRICGYACPTCRCFDVRDEALVIGNGGGQYERVRCWDTCTSEAYRRIAGGHNPRAAAGQRLRNRFLCKFHYYPEQYGPMGCTGCGRCIDSCPVNIDILEVIQRYAHQEL
ncbi:MAG: 4Fe-4S dicluster domain-containing protein [Chloroflexi bacterium]|nr:4Fe-4S dicluster domain-containing protein [Chloroflexota bacterium]